MPTLTLSVWSRTPTGGQTIVGECALPDPSYEQFAAAVYEFVTRVAPPNVPSFAACDFGNARSGGGPMASLGRGADVETAVRRLWRDVSAASNFRLR